MSEARRVVERAKAHGKYAAMFCFDGADARAMQAFGYRLCTISSDQTLLRAAARSELASARAG
jgi:2-keto-3-deoxy-L-rhamnonate aldolase RhmA